MDTKQIKFGVILSYISKIIGMAINFGFLPIMIRVLGTTEYGIYSIAQSIVSYLAILDFGFSSAYVRFYSKSIKENTTKIINGTFLILFLILGAIATICGIIISQNLGVIFGSGLNSEELEKTKILLYLLIFNLFVSFGTLIFSNYVIATESFIVQNCIQIVKQISSPFISLPLLFMGYASTGVIISLIFSNILASILYLIYSLKFLNMKFDFSNLHIATVLEVGKYSVFIFINLIVDQINNNVDTILLGRLIGSSSVAVYNIGYNLQTYFVQISTTISTLYIPRVHKMEEARVSNSEFSDLFIKLGRIQFMLLFFVVSLFLFVGKFFIKIWAGEDFADAYFVALLLMFPILIPLIQNIGIEIQRAKNLHMFRSWLYFVIAIFNVTISFILIPDYGAIGASIGTSLSYIVGNGLIMNWYYKNIIKLDIKQFWIQILNIFKALIFPVIAGIVTLSFFDINNIYNFLIFSLFYSILYAFFLLVFGLNSEEKLLLRSFIK
ncbi:lipopolysaccharide biosynthesis protein [Streptococcus sp. P25B114]